MKVTPALAEPQLAVWRETLSRPNASKTLGEHLAQRRWRDNRFGAAPPGLPAFSAVSEDLDWSISLECFLLQADRETPETRALIDAVGFAYEHLKPTLDHGEVWLGDILALRRAPAARDPLVPAELPTITSVNLAAVRLILNAASAIANDAPEPSEAAYLFFRRIYGQLVNALVSEVVEADRFGAPRIDFQSGARVTAPEAGSVFRELAGLPGANPAWQQIDPRPEGLQTWTADAQQMQIRLIAQWQGVVAALVDVLAHLNEGLDLLAAKATRRSKADFKARVAEQGAALARLFDDGFYRLLVVDVSERGEAEARRLRDMRLGLVILQREADRHGSPFAMTCDEGTARAILWHGQRADPLRAVDRKSTRVEWIDGLLTIAKSLVPAPRSRRPVESQT